VASKRWGSVLAMNFAEGARHNPTEALGRYLNRRRL
jgi:hypothetical protein